MEEDGGFPICAIVNGDLDRSLLRFLIAAEFDVDLARERISSMKKWREENDIDHMLRWILPDEKLAALNKQIEDLQSLIAAHEKRAGEAKRALAKMVQGANVHLEVTHEPDQLDGQ